MEIRDIIWIDLFVDKIWNKHHVEINEVEEVIKSSPKIRFIMKRSKKEPIPLHFKSVEDAGEFWDTHDLAEYWDKTKEADLTFNLRRRHFYIAILPGIAKELQRISEEQG